MINQKSGQFQYESTICEVLQLLRKFNGINQKEMAKKVGLSYPSYWRLENNLTHITFTHFRKVCQCMNYTPLDILEIVEKVWDSKQINPNVKVDLILFKELFLRSHSATRAAMADR